MKELMLYLHVPFCVRKCNYCDFLSAVHTQETIEKYVKALCMEVRERGREYSGRTVTSIFFGGGTPSLLLPAQISEIMEALRETFPVVPDAEITMECNPGTIKTHGEQEGESSQENADGEELQGNSGGESSLGNADGEELQGNSGSESSQGKTTEAERLSGYQKAGINRLSIGLQSANDEELVLLGRIHDYDAFLQTYRAARAAGFSNVSIDLMNALPGQTLDSWKETLEKVLALKPMPEHLSVYSLIMEEGTRFFGWNREGKFTGRLQIPSEELDREMYAYTGKRLREAGFEQYEISNYARDGYECRHNYGYWTRKEYLGLGLGAASLLDETRYSNETDMANYLRDPLAGRTSQKLSKKEQMEEFLFLGLRTCRGVKRKDFYEHFGERMDQYWLAVIRKNAADGLLLDDGEGIRLTAKGMDLSNYVSAQFLLEE